MFSGWDLLIYGCVNIVTCTISGISGGGAGFISMPVMIALGLTPATAVSTAKLTGLATSISSLQGIGKMRTTSKRQIAAIMLLALVIGLLAPLAITNIHSGAYRTALGSLILVMVPVMIWKRRTPQPGQISRLRKVGGYIALACTLTLQGIFGGGLGTLVNVTFITLLGNTPLQANILKRYSQLVLNGVIVLSVFGSGLINWRVAAVGITTGLAGGAIGSRIALKHGEEIISRVLIGLMIASGLWLILG